MLVALGHSMLTRDGHQDVLTFQAELGQGGEATTLALALVDAMREVMKLRGEVRVVPPGTIPEGAKKIDDRRTWD